MVGTESWLTGDLALTAYFTQDSIPTDTEMANIKFSLSPNPAHHVVQIASVVPLRKVVLYNVLGIVQEEEAFEPNGATSTLLTLKDLSPGVYWIEAYFKTGGRVVRRLVKN